MKHGSLFSGIGGFDLAADWMGWENMFHCENNEFGRRILNYYWPQAQSYEDITKTDFTIWRGKIDILTGGFPCQPYSTSGKRKGKEDDRHLWPEMYRAVREIQPAYVVAENVTGLINWGGGLVFEEVQVDLENEGYEVQSFILPAGGIGAPHKRERVWFLAYSENFQRNAEREESQQPGTGRNARGGIKRNVSEGVFTNAGGGIQEKRTHINGVGRVRKQNEGNSWSEFPTQHPFCNGNDGISSRLDGITFPKWRNESIKGGGNAIVPQVAFEIFKAIEATK